MDKTSLRFHFNESNAESYADIVLCTALDIGEHLLKNGADGLAFDTIAVSGVKSSMPHGVPENIPLSKGF